LKGFQLYHEKELLLLVANGDERAFKELFRLYAKLLFPFFVKLTRSHLAAEELIQETMLRVWQNRQKLPSLESPRSWLFKIGVNQAYTWMQKEARNARTPVFSDEMNDLHTYDTIQAKELQHELALAVKELPPRRKLIYQLSRERDMKVTEIAGHLDVSVSTVKNALSAALSSIWKRLQRTVHIIPFLLLTIF
jgi:RNA polymerase sigma factor (sigma-70 family)